MLKEPKVEETHRLSQSKIAAAVRREPPYMNRKQNDEQHTESEKDK